MSRRPKNLKEAMPGISKILRRFAPQIRKQGGLLALSGAAIVAETGFRLLEPWPLKYIFDNILLTGFHVKPLGVPILDRLDTMGLLTVLALSLVAISGLRGVAAYASTVGMAIAASRVMTDIRSNLYAHIQRLSLAFHHNAKNGDLIARVTSDIERLREVTVMAMLPLFANILTTVGMVVVMFWLNVELALIALVVFPIFVISSTHMTQRIRTVARSSRKREGAMAATAAEAISAIKVVQALSLQNILERSFAKNNQKSLADSAQAQKLKAGLERSVEILVAIVTSVVLWRGVQLVQQGVVTPGDLLVFITYLKLAFKPMRQVAKYIGQIAKATASGERIVDLLEVVPKIQDLRGAMEAPPFRGSVRFKNITFGYDAAYPILKNLSFTVKPGERIALVGSSGGGKSTLVSLLLRLYDPQQGQILIDGSDLRSYKLESLRRQISIVLQDSVLFATTIRENIAYGSLGATDAQIEAAARLANAHDFIMELPDGYDTVLAERGATLSGGQRQRIAIARAAIRDAAIVILDEPTVGLDNQSERAVSEALARLTHDRTTFLITHDLRAACNVDRIFYLENGQICESGTHEELMRLGRRYAALYQLQGALIK